MQADILEKCRYKFSVDAQCAGSCLFHLKNLKFSVSNMGVLSAYMLN